MKHFLLLVFIHALSWGLASPDSARLVLRRDSSWVVLRLTLADSLRIADFGPTHSENSTWARLQVMGQLGAHFTFTAQGTAYTDIANRPYYFHDYQPYRGIPYNLQDSTRRTWDWFSARSEYNLNPHISLFSGVDFIRTGPAYRNPVNFRGSQYNYRPWQDSTRWNDHPVPLPQAGFDMQIAWVRYTQWIATPKHEKNLGRYLHTHRLSLSLPGKIELGLGETILYGSTVEPSGTNPNPDGDSLGRSLEWIYVMPFVPYFFAEHFQGDRDNGSIYMDLTWTKLRRWTVYAELLLDDSKSPLSLFDESWWGNKWAFTGGTRWNTQIGDWRTTWLFEYTRIEPWVYTHHKGAAYRYTHYGQSLGSELGPNSQELFTQLEITWNKVQLQISAASVAKDTAFGSRIEDLHTPTDPLDKKFLASGSTLRYREYGAQFRLYPWKLVWIGAGFWQYLGDYLGIRAQTSAGITW